MHKDQIELWQHHHSFNMDKKSIEKRTLIVAIITLITMILEIIFGWLSNSMALLADGWHMGTHAFALGVSFIAYVLARRYSKDYRFTFGTWKIEILGAYTSAIVLGIVGIIMIFASMERIIKPLNIQYNQALIVAIIGLIVNLACAIILNLQTHSHEHDHHDSEHDDLNLKSAYLHVLADALTSVLAIVALFSAKYLSYVWMDPLTGIAGAILIIRWSVSLLKETSAILLEHEMDSPIVKEIIEQIESDDDTKISGLHLWKVAQNKYACIVSLVTGKKYSIDDYKARLQNIHELAHVTVEINLCQQPLTERPVRHMR